MLRGGGDGGRNAKEVSRRFAEVLVYSISAEQIIGLSCGSTNCKGAAIARWASWEQDMVHEFIFAGGARL